MIPVFIASSDRFAEVEWMTEYSIRENTRHPLAVHVVRPQWYGMSEGGCTGFTHVRWAIPQLCRELGYDFGIYLDVDMLVTGDISELWEYRKKGKWACLKDGSNEVSVICSTLKYPDKAFLHNRHKGTLPGGDHYPCIPLEWNVEDRVTEAMRLLHFTDLATQPWFFEHPCNEAVALYEEYRARFHSRDGAEPHAGSDWAA